jgi:prepilin-type N-terminal cleavage/methylation domain-containing protein
MPVSSSWCRSSFTSSPPPLATGGRLGRRRGGFTLIEVVIVIVLIGIITAIAIPKFSKAGEGSADTVLKGDLAVMHRAVAYYEAEHAAKPTAADVVGQLTQYTDDAGVVSAAKSVTYKFGPYLRTVPRVPVGPNKGAMGVAVAPAAGVGWLYDETTGDFTANMTPSP